MDTEKTAKSTAYEVQRDNIALISTKSRVAASPKKLVTIPRLEVLSNLIAATLTQYIRKKHGKQHVTYIWTDSQVALGWINNSNKKPEIWVHNRVAKIREIKAEIKHCDGKDNPANLASRDTRVTELLQSVWWTGPPWLLTYKS
jgi:hypothetical protein